MDNATILQNARELEAASWDALLNHGVDCTICHEVLEDGEDLNRDGCDVGKLLGQTHQHAYDHAARLYEAAVNLRSKLHQGGR